VNDSGAIAYKNFVALTVPFSVAIGCMYAFGYWGHFGIDVLQYVGLIDVAKLAIYPLLVIAFTSLLTIAWLEIGLTHLIPVGAGADTRVGHLIRKIWRPMLLLVIAAMAIVAIAVPDPVRWYVVAMLAVPFGTTLTHVGPLQALLPNPRVRALVIQQLVLFPLIALAFGRASAIGAEAGRGRVEVDSTRSNVGALGAFKPPLIYLGKLGNTTFVLEQSTRQVLLLTLSDGSLLALKRR
jgi:hypothetical protein